MFYALSALFTNDSRERRAGDACEMFATHVGLVMTCVTTTPGFKMATLRIMFL